MSGPPSTSDVVGDTVLYDAHTWEALAEYERTEAIFQLLKRISYTCLRHGHLRVMEREELTCFGAHADANHTTSTRRLLLYGRVLHRHREALLSLVRQTRLHSVRDLDTVVTAGLQSGDYVPHLLLPPLAPSPYTKAYVHWHRVYTAMRCGMFRQLHARQKKLKNRLRQLIHDSHATIASPRNPARDGESDLGDTGSSAADDEGGDSMPNDTLRFYTEEFTRLFSSNAAATEQQRRDGDDPDARAWEPAAMHRYMNAAKETRVSLACIAATVPTVFVAWSCRYPDCVQWLRDNLFNDRHLHEIMGTTGLSGRYAVLLDKDPWRAFATDHGDVLPRPPRQTDGFRIELLKPLAKRAQIVLINVDADAAEARATFDVLRIALRGWKSPEVDLLSLWAGPEGLQSEVATLFQIEELPFIVDARPGGLLPAAAPSKTRARAPPVTPARLQPVIVRSSRESLEAAKALHGIADTPVLLKRRGARSLLPLSPSADVAAWHNLTAAERTHAAGRITTYLTQRRLPLCFAAFFTREYFIRNPYTSDSWKALESVPSSQVSMTGEYVTTQDLLPIASELRRLHGMDNFEFHVRVMEPSAPLLSSLEWATPQMRMEGKMHVAVCSQCATLLDVNTTPHVRCLHCRSTDKKSVLCVTCAFTTRCHPPHHILLRIPAGVWAPSLPLMWGPSNIAPFTIFAGQFVTNKSDCHHGVYCNMCRKMIHGIRWKCAVCYQFDLCRTCAAMSFEKADHAERRPPAVADAPDASPVKGTSTAPPNATASPNTPLHHDGAAHPMLFIPSTQGADANGMLKPRCYETLSEWLATL